MKQMNGNYWKTFNFNLSDRDIKNIYSIMNETMDGWMGMWMDRWMGMWVDGWVCGWMDGWIDRHHFRTPVKRAYGAIQANEIIPQKHHFQELELRSHSGGFFNLLCVGFKDPHKKHSTSNRCTGQDLDIKRCLLLCYFEWLLKSRRIKRLKDI